MEDWRFKAISISIHNSKRIGWSNFGDVGDIVTIEEFEELEYIYIDFASRIFQSIGVGIVSIYCESKNNIRIDANDLYSKIAIGYSTIKPYQEVKIDSDFFNIAIKMLLREMIIGRIESKDGTVVLRFGYDLYMYLNSDKVNLDDLIFENLDSNFVKM